MWVRSADSFPPKRGCGPLRFPENSSGLQCLTSPRMPVAKEGSQGCDSGRLRLSFGLQSGWLNVTTITVSSTCAAHRTMRVFRRLAVSASAAAGSDPRPRVSPSLTRATSALRLAASSGSLMLARLKPAYSSDPDWHSERQISKQTRWNRTDCGLIPSEKSTSYEAWAEVIRSPQPSHERLPAYSPRHRQGASRGKVRCCKRTRMARVAATLFMRCLSLADRLSIGNSCQIAPSRCRTQSLFTAAGAAAFAPVRRKSICGKRRSRHEKILGSAQTPVTYGFGRIAPAVR